MAVRGKPLDVATIKSVQRDARNNSIRGAARNNQVSRNTVRKYVRGQQ